MERKMVYLSSDRVVNVRARVGAASKVSGTAVAVLFNVHISFERRGK